MIEDSFVEFQAPPNVASSWSLPNMLDNHPPNIITNDCNNYGCYQSCEYPMDNYYEQYSQSQPLYYPEYCNDAQTAQFSLDRYRGPFQAEFSNAVYTANDDGYQSLQPLVTAFSFMILKSDFGFVLCF